MMSMSPDREDLRTMSFHVFFPAAPNKPAVKELARRLAKEIRPLHLGYVDTTTL